MLTLRLNILFNQKAENISKDVFLKSTRFETALLITILKENFFANRDYPNILIVKSIDY